VHGRALDVVEVYTANRAAGKFQADLGDVFYIQSRQV
jgi:hypothetical protein